MTKKLLLADDSVTIQKVIGIIFATEDYELHVCDDGNEALEKALNEYPDLVIADISMPGKDGFELCRAIKAEPRLEHTSVLLLPGTFEHFDESHAVAVGADGWISKPFESQALLDKVAQLLEAEPVRPAGAEGSQTEDVVDFSADEVAEETIEEVVELQEAAVDEVVLGLDEIEELEESAMATPTEEESADDIWDAVSFEEEELQPAGDLSAAVEKDVMEEFSAVDEVADFSADEDVSSAELPQPEDEPFELSDEVDEFGAEEPLELEAVEDTPLVLEEAASVAEDEPASAEWESAEEPVFEDEPAAETPFELKEEEELPVVEAEETFEEEEGILDLAEDDILEEEPVEEFVSVPIEMADDEVADAEESFAVEEDVVADGLVPELVVEEPGEEEVVAEYESGPVEEPVEAAEDGFYYDAAGAEEEVVAEPLVEPVAEPEDVAPVELVEQQLRELSEDELKEVVGKVAGPIIEKLAGEMLEQIVWEVVPDLAESMIREEIRKIRQGAVE